MSRIPLLKSRRLAPMLGWSLLLPLSVMALLVFVGLALPAGTASAGPPAQEKEVREQAPPVASPTACAPSYSITGALTTGDPLQQARIYRDETPSACGSSQPCPGVWDPGTTRAYDAYSFTNLSTSSKCITVNLNALTCYGTNYQNIFSVAYRGSYDPNNVCNNYLADIGIAPAPTGSYSFDVPAGTDFVVVVHGINQGVTCPQYNLTVSGFECLSRCPGSRFNDVCPGDYFYDAVIYLSDHGIISGYSDGSFRPFNNTTRAQLSKIIVLAEGWPLVNPPQPSFNDVPTSNPFYQYIETAAARDVISGYADGTFRPFNDVTRSQLCKIVVLAEGWTLANPQTPTFSDVPRSNPFYQYVETAYDQGIISGYADGTFRPGVNATRGQISKIVYSAITR